MARRVGVNEARPTIGALANRAKQAAAEDNQILAFTMRFLWAALFSFVVLATLIWFVIWWQGVKMRLRLIQTDGMTTMAVGAFSFFAGTYLLMTYKLFRILRSLAAQRRGATGL